MSTNSGVLEFLHPNLPHLHWLSRSPSQHCKHYHATRCYPCSQLDDKISGKKQLNKSIIPQCLYWKKKVKYVVPSWKLDTPCHETPDMQMIQDFCMLMPSVAVHKIHFHPAVYVHEDSLADFHTVHIPQLLELVLKELIK